MSLGNKDIMAKNIRYYMEKRNKERADICKDLDIKYTTFTDWINAKTYPRIDKIELLANYFGVSKSDLVEEKQIENAGYYLNDETREIAQEIFDNPEMKTLFSTVRNETPERLMAYAEFIKKMKDMDGKGE